MKKKKKKEEKQPKYIYITVKETYTPLYAD